MSEDDNSSELTPIQQLVADRLEAKERMPSQGAAKNTQADRDSVHLAGEYYVAAELHRRGVHATITYGNAKAADILAFSLDGERFARVEVKTSRPDKGGVLAWTGTLDRFPKQKNQFWVLCLVPNKGNEKDSPRFWILTADEMRQALAVKIETYALRRNGAGDPTKWMWTFSPAELDALGAHGAWHKLTEFLSI